MSSKSGIFAGRWAVFCPQQEWCYGRTSKVEPPPRPVWCRRVPQAARAVQAAMNSGVITSPGASSGTPGGYAQTYSAEVPPTACCSANAVCGAKSACAMEQAAGPGWAAPAPRRAGERSAPPQHRSPTGQRQNGQGRFLHRRGGHGQHVGTTGHLGFKLPVPAQQFRQGGAGQPGSSTVDEDLAGIVGKKSRGGQKHHPSHGRARAGGAVGAQRR